MYLLVFVTLMIAIIGMYTQVLGLQAARFASSQSGIGSAMLQWHAAAVSMAVSIMKTNPAAYAAVAATGCSLTFKLPPGVGGAFAQCPPPVLFGGYPSTTETGAITNSGTPPALNLIANVTTGQNECVHLAPICGGNNATFGCAAGQCGSSYDTTDYQFYSILYQDAGTNQNFVVTFLPAPVISAANPAPGYLFSASGANLGISASDLLRQLNNTGMISNGSYGSFQKFDLSTPQLAVTGGSYNLPLPPSTLKNLCNPSATYNCIANGSVAVIGSPDGF